MQKRSLLFKLQHALVVVVVTILWLVTTLVALWDVYVLRQMYYIGYAYLARQMGSGDYELADVVGYCLLPFLVLCFIAFATFTGEYHRQHLGQPKSWRLFAVTIFVQVLVLLIYEWIQ